MVKIHENKNRKSTEKTNEIYAESKTTTRDDSAIYVKSAHLKRFEYIKIYIDTICEKRDSIH